MKKYGTKTNFTSPSAYLKKPKAPREVRLNVVKAPKKAAPAGYKIPKTPKVSGYKWGG